MKTNRIELNPRVCNGKPVIAGTRIPVSTIVSMVADGEPWGRILEGYPELQEVDIKAALHYAASSIEHTEFADVSVGYY